MLILTDQPWQFFWITGALSSFLDNTPTYLGILYYRSFSWIYLRCTKR
ncbi:MAG: sodium:proton antiporter [Anaerobutyricum sp.]